MLDMCNMLRDCCVALKVYYYQLKFLVISQKKHREDYKNVNPMTLSHSI